MKHLAVTVLLAVVMLSVTVSRYAGAPPDMQSVCADSVCSIVAIP